MINKKNLLGTKPIDLGTKDAIHVAIVAVRAGGPLNPGQRCGLNADREAVADAKGVGVADPFFKGVIVRGQPFWLLLCQDEVPNVAHVWEHPSVDFTPPVVEVKRNKYLQQHADEYGVTFEQLMEAAAYAVENDKPAKYPGSKSAEELEAIESDIGSDVFYEWAKETLYEFTNDGTECCPEYRYPDCGLFVV